MLRFTLCSVYCAASLLKNMIMALLNYIAQQHTLEFKGVADDYFPSCNLGKTCCTVIKTMICFKVSMKRRSCGSQGSPPRFVLDTA